MRRRTDANQNEIVDGLRALGATVHVTSNVGDGFPDIVVGFRGYNWLFEIKDGNKPPSKRRLTPDERKFLQTWKGSTAVIKDLGEAIEYLVGYDNPAEIPPF